jgi:hypothetical protein
MNNPTAIKLGLLIALALLTHAAITGPRIQPKKPALAGQTDFPWSLSPEAALTGPEVAVVVFDYQTPPEITNLPKGVIDRYGWLFVSEKHWGAWEDSVKGRINPHSLAFIKRGEDGKISLLEYKGEVFHPVPQEASFYP